MILSDFVISFIAEQDVHHIFLVPGGGNMHLVDSVGKETRIDFVACLHEQTAAIAADAYAQYSKKLGVALVTTGPGSTNAVTGVAGAWVESVPLLIISGQVKTSDIKPCQEMRMLGFQETDITTIVQPITKYAVTVKDPETIKYHLEKAVFLASTGRPGPVWIAIPLDVQAKKVVPRELIGFDPAKEKLQTEDNLAAIPKAVSRMLDYLARANRPVILAGNGIRVAQSEEIFIRIFEKLKIPILTTWKACDLLSEDHPLFFGRPGTVAQRGANFIQQNSDFILTLGARLDFGQIGYASETFARAAIKVIVDIDSLELSKFPFRVDIPIVADVADFMKELEIQIQDFNHPDWSSWQNQCSEWRHHYPIIIPEYRNKKDFVSTYVLFDVLSNQMISTDLLVPGSSGSCSDMCMQTFRVKRGQRILNSLGFGAMGFGLPQTIGACLAGGGRRTVCVNGDGGFQLNLQDLETVNRLGLPIKYFILNNRGYASIRTTQKNYFQGRLVASDPSSGLTLPDICKISSAYGISNNRIANNAELEKNVAEALSSIGPFISEVMIDPEEESAPKVKSALKTDGSLVSKPLEDLWPFLPREEFLKNMLIPPISE